MRKGILWGAAIAAAAAIGLTAVLSSDAPAPSTVGETDTTTAVSASYRVLGAWDGKLAVFLPDTATPERVYEVWISTLPAEEQSRLHDGIPVYSKAELSSLLEDYIG